MEIRWPNASEWKNKFAPQTKRGWLLAVVGAVISILNAKGLVEEGIATVGQVPMVISWLSPILVSPWFGVSLVILGVGYVIFVPDAHHPSPHATIAAWIASIACGVSLVALGALLMLATVNGPKRLAPRLLSQLQASKFKNALSAGLDFGPQIDISAFVSCYDCYSYASNIAETMNDVHQWTDHGIGVGYVEFGINVHYRGLIIVAFQDNPPPAAKALASALKASDIKFSWGPLAAPRPPKPHVLLLVMPEE